jgi:hypothetical protein
MGELDDKMANFFLHDLLLQTQEIYKSFNSISKISYVRNSKLFFRHSTRKYNGCGPVISTPPSGPSSIDHSTSSTYSSEDPENHLLDLW